MSDGISDCEREKSRHNDSAQFERVVMPLEEVAKRADKIINLKILMDVIFPNGGNEHLRMCIMAAIHDAYLQGIKDCKSA